MYFLVLKLTVGKHYKANPFFDSLLDYLVDFTIAILQLKSNFICAFYWIRFHSCYWVDFAIWFHNYLGTSHWTLMWCNLEESTNCFYADSKCNNEIINNFTFLLHGYVGWGIMALYWSIFLTTMNK